MKSKNKPLVSICIPNYNYGRYLRQCLDSVLSQTYSNYEVIFRDNASTDNSMEIAYEYQKKFREKGIYFSVSQNKRNFGSDYNSTRCIQDTEGQYYYVLASDDAIAPTFIEKCVEVFEKYPSVGLVMTNRTEMDDDGNLYDSLPFYNRSCIIPGDEQAAVFMMAGIAIPGQRMLKRGAVNQLVNFHASYQVAGDWFINYRYTCTGDIAYIKEPLCLYRVHFGNETSESENSLLGVFEHYKLINHFFEIANEFQQKSAINRYPEAVKKLGSMCLRYATGMMRGKRLDVARKYLNLAPVFDVDIVSNETYMELLALLDMPEEARNEVLQSEEFNTKRNKSYDPPQGYIEIEDNRNE